MDGLRNDKEAEHGAPFLSLPTLLRLANKVWEKEKARDTLGQEKETVNVGEC